MIQTRNQDRIERINDLSALVSENNRKLDEILEQLEWDRNTLQEGVAMATCPLDKNHHVPAKSMEKHTNICKWLNQGYSQEELANQLPSSHFYYKNSMSVVPVLIDQSTQSTILSHSEGSNKAVPVTMERAQKDLTPSERLAIYDYVVETAKKTNKQPSVCSSDLEFDPAAAFRKEEKDHPKSHLEVMAEKRDYKRRRQTYRGKNVHITRKSQTDVMREVIDSYMELITQSSQDYNDMSVDEDRSQAEECQSEHSRSPTRHSVSPSFRRKRERSRSPDRSRSHVRGQRSPRRKGYDESSHSNRDRHRHKKKHKHSDRDSR